MKKVFDREKFRPLRMQKVKLYLETAKMLIMKKNKINSALIIGSLFACSIFASCLKEGISLNYSCAISQLNLTHRSVCNGESWSNSETLSFEYDDEGRLSKWEWQDGEYMLFVYDGDGKLEKVLEDNETITTLFTWEENKVTGQRYYGNSPSSYKAVITFNPDNEISLVEYYFESEMGAYIVYTWKNGNLVRMEEHEKDDWKKITELMGNRISQKSLISKKIDPDKWGIPAQIEKNMKNDFKLKHISTFTYDTKFNPFSPHKALGLMSPGEVYFLSRNNLLTDKYEGGGETWTTTYEHEYNPQSYPSKTVMNEEYECSYSYVMEFSYNNCD